MSAVVRKIKLLPILVGFVALVALLLNVQGVMWSAETTPETGVVNVADVPVKYEVIREDNDYMVFANYDYTSADDVKGVIRAMRTTADTWASQGRTFRASIVFVKPLTVDEFRAFVKEMDVLVYASTAWAWRNEGEITELGLPPVFEKDENGNPRLFYPQEGGDPIDPMILAQGTDDKQVVGIVSTEVEFNSGNYKQVVKDERVAAIDVLKQVLIDMVEVKDPAAEVEHIWAPQSVIYWAMVETGLLSQPSKR